MTASSPASTDTRQRLLLVTGMSGAGKSTALDVLEDLGWETIDNFPVRLLERLVGSLMNNRAPRSPSDLIRALAALFRERS